MKKLIFTLINTLLFCVVLAAQTPADAPWGKVWKAKSNDLFAKIYHGAVHIGPHKDDYTTDPVNYPSEEALKDSYLWVEGGITTPSVTYLFEDRWHLWPDYVFNYDYDLIPLDDLEAFIKKYKHLPGVVTQQEVKKNGVKDADMNIILLEKIEELTLYTIEQHKELKAQKELNQSLIERIEKLELSIKKEED